MSFNIALSGLNAAQKDLDVTSSNIANVNTTGFKESRAEFVDVYAASLLAGGKTKVGDGVLTADVAQQFAQGSIKFTSNALDLAITGNGFFGTVPEIDSLEVSYTRAGQFKLNSENYVVNSAGGHLLGFPVNDDGSSSSVALSTAKPIRIPTASGAPQATVEVDVRMNLPAGDAVPGFAFDHTDPLTYNNSTSVTVFDSLGESHVMTYYYRKVAANEWDMHTAVDGTLVNIPAGAAAGALGPTPLTANAARLVFDSGGDYIAQSPATITTDPLGATILANGSDPTQTITVDFNLDTLTPNINEPTQFASGFEVTSLEQDGLAVGRLTGLDIDVDGLVRATYSNGTSQPLARIALVGFANNQGLTQVGGPHGKKVYHQEKL